VRPTLVVEDLEPVAGMVKTSGSVSFEARVAQRAPIEVERLRAAGAIVVGRTSTPGSGYTAICKNPLIGGSHNPCNPDRTRGGSSGGPLGAEIEGRSGIRVRAGFSDAASRRPPARRSRHRQDRALQAAGLLERATDCFSSAPGAAGA